MSLLTYATLFLAVLAETIGTTALQASQQFTKPLPSVIVVVAYAAAFYLLALTLRSVPVGVAYALWSGLGILLIALIGFVVFGQTLDWPAVVGMSLIVGGIAVIQLFSAAATH
ncbi:DMT family transporter [Primorskyibacter flagellatus]|uniref:Small multidrug resistance pump n=1 Tax=Primorskyibacter flagellatus TaxID=1387277 RepID=A0A1W1Z1T1_9RHOB|nr:SMR family transporter [Primorskyibacter flagellatus]SMC41898.1 small multidrug resistance pump [Primorskyibacter flagellatus]